MQYAMLGRTGVQVSRLCLGTGMLGSLGNSDHAECTQMVQTALDAGVNFIDTADFYSNGESEQIVGIALRGRRDEVVLATKFYSPMPIEGRVRNRRGASRRWIMQAVEDSLRRLQTDYIDLYQQHHFDPNTDPDETLGALSDLIQQGKIRMAGISNFASERIVESHWASERGGHARVRCGQYAYSLFRRGVERDILPTCARYGMGVITWSPLDGSWLSGQIRERADIGRSVRLRAGGQQPDDSDSELNRRKLELIGAIDALASEAGLSIAQLAIAFVTEHPDVTSAIIGARTISQLEATLAGADCTLDPGLLDALDELLTPGTDVATAIEATGSAAPVELRRAYRRRPR